MIEEDTIAAIATPPGTGGVCIIRISGSNALSIAEKITHQNLKPRIATYTNFYEENQEIFDQGLAIYFKNPHSFTGEDVVELQGHGGIAVAQGLLQLVIRSGARLANAGEFTQRAYLNNKIDLAQAEAVADLINAQTVEAVKAASRSLQGNFSNEVNELAEEIFQLRVYIEAALDFSEEEIDFLSEGRIKEKLENWGRRLSDIIQQAQQGVFLSQGINLVLAGKPNAGKSSLLNCLLNEERAIVTSQAGTTRDIIKEVVQINGIPVNIMDTAGLRESNDIVEQEGIKRSQKAMSEADIIVWMIDGNQIDDTDGLPMSSDRKTIIVANKADIVDQAIIEAHSKFIWISAKTGKGIEILKENIMQYIGVQSGQETSFTARERHITALKKAYAYYQKAFEQLQINQHDELVAEDLRYVHEALGEITGKITSETLLGAIFSGFCIGK